MSRNPHTTRAKQAKLAADRPLGKAMLHGPGIIGNMHGASREVVRKPAAAAVRAVVANWRNRWPGKQHTDANILPSIQVLERHEAQLADYSPDAVRLLAGLRAEWSRRYPTQQAA